LQFTRDLIPECGISQTREEGASIPGKKEIFPLMENLCVGLEPVARSFATDEVSSRGEEDTFCCSAVATQRCIERERERERGGEGRGKGDGNGRLNVVITLN